MNSILPDISIVKEEQESSESENVENDSEFSYPSGYDILLSGENVNTIKIECDVADTETAEIKIKRGDFTIKLEPGTFCESGYEQDIGNHLNALQDMSHYNTMIEFSRPSSSAIKSERGTPFNEEYEVEFINPDMDEFPGGHSFEDGKIFFFIYGNQRLR